MLRNTLKYILLSVAMLMAAALSAQKTFTLVIDAGHGGKDAGAVGAFSYEKNINLSIALALGNLVERNCPDVHVIYTRKTDVFIPLGDRPNIANKAKADLFISVHTNSAGSNHTAHGVETYTLCLEKMNTNLEIAKRENSVITYESDYRTRYEGFDPNSVESYIIFQFMQNNYMRQSVELAQCIQRQYAGSGRKNKGVKQANLLVLRNTSMPAVLTEVGFITNPDEERFLNSPAGVQTIASCIFNGFLAYRKAHGARNLPAPLHVSAPAETPQPAAESAQGTSEQKADEPQPKAREPQPAAKPQQPSQGAPGGVVTYRVQFATSSAAVNPREKRFSGFPAVTSIRQGNVYKHYMGDFPTISEARQALREIRNTYSDAFIVKFQDGKRVQ
ncbi:MAG: N-acetylmuramoyl-L-alanine amidase [Alloprevotella sp.]|nr:N-acetylmuramoyl-L-alanine amidase [Alloprevotella sp.]